MNYIMETSIQMRIETEDLFLMKKAVRTFSDIESKLSKELNGENLKLFNELVKASDEISATSGVENFKIGFRLCVLMMCDSVFSDNSIILKD